MRIYLFPVMLLVSYTIGELTDRTLGFVFLGCCVAALLVFLLLRSVLARLINGHRL